MDSSSAQLFPFLFRSFSCFRGGGLLEVGWAVSRQLSAGFSVLYSTVLRLFDDLRRKFLTSSFSIASATEWKSTHSHSCNHRLSRIKQAVREAATICPAPCDLLTLKVVSETRVTCANSVTILVFPGLSVLDLGPDVRDRQTSDVRQHHRLMPPPRGRDIKTV